MNDYSASEEYKSEIHDLVVKVLLLCDQYKIPVFMTFAVENGLSGTRYMNEMLSPEMEGRVLTDDQIAKHALVMNGFEVVPSITEPDFEEELEAEAIESE